MMNPAPCPSSLCETETLLTTSQESNLWFIISKFQLTQQFDSESQNFKVLTVNFEIITENFETATQPKNGFSSSGNKHP